MSTPLNNGIMIPFGENLSVQDSRVSLTNTSFTPSIFFGDSIANSFANKDFYFYDALNGGFLYNLNYFLSQNNKAQIDDKYLSDDISRLNYSNSKPNKNNDVIFNNIMSNFRVDENLTLKFTANTTNIGIQNFNKRNDLSSFNSETLRSPFFDKSKSGIGVNSEIDLGNNEILLGYHNTDYKIGLSSELKSSENITASFNGSNNIFDQYAIAFGLLIENGSLLDSEGSGAFSLDESKNYSQYMGLNLSKNLTNNLNLKFISAHGVSQLSHLKNNFIAGSTNIYSSSYNAMIDRYNLFHENDKFTFSISQPHRVDRGDFKLKLAQLAETNGNIEYLYKNASLTPSGRQVNLGLDYTYMPSNDMMIGFKTTLIRNRNHVSDSNLEQNFSISTKFRF